MDWSPLLRSIIDCEDRGDWPKAQTLALDAIGKIVAGNLTVPEHIYHYLDDVEIRMDDRRYTRYQRGQIRSYLS